MASNLDYANMALRLRMAQDMRLGVSHHRANAVIYYTQFAYPIVLLFLFIGAFAAHGIITANNESGPAAALMVTGPGGKPLPNTPPPRSRRPKKRGFNHMKRLVFIWISAGQIFTFIGNAINIMVHALTERESGWWCGEATAVSVSKQLFSKCTNRCLDLRCGLGLSVFPLLDISCRQRFVPQYCSPNHLACCFSRRTDTLWSVSSSLYVSAPRD